MKIRQNIIRAHLSFYHALELMNTWGDGAFVRLCATAAVQFFMFGWFTGSHSMRALQASHACSYEYDR